MDPNVNGTIEINVTHLVAYADADPIAKPQCEQTRMLNEEQTAQFKINNQLYARNKKVLIPYFLQIWYPLFSELQNVKLHKSHILAVGGVCIDIYVFYQSVLENKEL